MFQRNIRELMGDHSIIYFYSDDCFHCKIETPRLVSLIDSWHEFPLSIAAIYTGTDASAWKDYIRKNFQTDNPYINWIHLADLDRQSNFPVDYGIVSTPKIFLLDESLRIRGRGILTPTLKEMLTEQAAEDNKAYDYLSQIFPSEELSPDAVLDLEARKDAVDKIYEGVKIANRDGYAIMIGHVDKSVKVLPQLFQEIYPELIKKGYRIATPSTLL